MTTITATEPLIGAVNDFNGVNYSGTFIPSIWSAKLNVKFYAATTFGDISNTNWEGEIKSMGDKVLINNVPSITIAAYQVGTTLSYQVPTPDTIELPIDKAYYFGVNVSDVVEYQAKPDLMSMFTGDAANQLKIQVDTECFLGACFSAAADTPSLADSDNVGATAGAISGSYDLGTDAAPIALTGGNILEKLTALSAVLDEQNVPETDRWLVLTPYERNLLMQSNLAQAQFMGDSQSMVRNGRIGQIDKFTVYVSNLTPRAAANKDYSGAAYVGNGGVSAKRHAVLAGHKSALTFASQISKVEHLRNPNDFGDLVRGLIVYGRKAVKPEAFALLQVAG